MLRQANDGQVSLEDIAVRHWIGACAILALPFKAVAFAPPPPPPPTAPPANMRGFTEHELATRPAPDTGKAILDDFAKEIVASHVIPPLGLGGPYVIQYFLSPNAELRGLCSAQELEVFMRKATDGKFYPEYRRLTDVYWVTGPLSGPPVGEGLKTATEGCRSTVSTAKLFFNPDLFDLAATLTDVQNATRAAAGNDPLKYSLSCAGSSCGQTRLALAQTSMTDLSRIERADCEDRSGQDCYELSFGGRSKASIIKIWLQDYMGDTPPRLTKIEVLLSS